MSQPLLAVIAKALPSEELFESRLRHLSIGDRADLLDHFDLVLPGSDVIIGLPNTASLARGLARLRGVPALLAQHDGAPAPGGQTAEETLVEQAKCWSLPTPDPLPEDVQSAVILTQHLQNGLPELLVSFLASQRGWTVRAVAAVAERTNFRGRTRLELQGMRVHAALQVADTPRGLEIERRFPRVD